MGVEHRTHIGPTIAVGVLGVFAAIWVAIAVQHRMGLTTNPLRIDRTGTAEVSSCSKSALGLWLTMTCQARVRWEGSQEAVVKRLESVQDVSGTTVEVHLRNDKRSRGSPATRVTTADFPFRQDAALVFVLLIGIPAVGLGLGFLIGDRLARLLPKPPPEKLVLRPMRRSGRKPKRPRKR